MVAKKKAAKKDEEIEVLKINQQRISVNILGHSPCVYNAMSFKVKQDLLFPRNKKNAAERASTLKHDPLREYRESVYRTSKDDAPTRLLLPCRMFKAALKGVAVDMPGAAKAQIGRLTWVEGDYASVYGTPQLLMSVVRSADMNHTPDIRTRAILPRWACTLSITLVTPMLKDVMVLNLLAAAGMMRGVGDGRPEKGSFSYGQFELVSSDDSRFLEVMEERREVQDAALLEPEPYDVESNELFTWFQEEVKKRGFKELQSVA